MDRGDLSPEGVGGIKQLQADHAPAFRVDVQNKWTYIYTIPYAFMSFIGTSFALFYNTGNSNLLLSTG